MRGRVVALYMMIFMGGTPLGAPIIGWVGEAFGARWTLIGGGGRDRTRCGAGPDCGLRGPEARFDRRSGTE